MKDLKGKKVLLFSSQFFNYHILIKEEIEKKGAIVHWYDERNNPSSVEKIILRKAQFLLAHKIDRYYLDVAEKEKDFMPDYIFFVNPDAVTKKSLNNLKSIFPECKFILYMWDSVKNKGAEKIIECFDNKYSFDSDDCDKYKMKFRPLFYADTFERKFPQSSFKYDVSFIGTVHSDRAKILWDIKDYCEKNNLNYYFYLYVPGKLLLYLRLLFNKDLRKWDKKYIHTESVKKEAVAKVSASTRCVIDINHPKQSGLTMRTIEMIGLKQKLITTNENIKNYDFYCEENQIAINRKKIVLDKEKMIQEYVEIPEEIYKKYSLSSWVNDIFLLN